MFEQSLRGVKCSKKMVLDRERRSDGHREDLYVVKYYRGSHLPSTSAGADVDGRMYWLPSQKKADSLRLSLDNESHSGAWIPTNTRPAPAVTIFFIPHSPSKSAFHHTLRSTQPSPVFSSCGGANRRCLVKKHPTNMIVETIESRYSVDPGTLEKYLENKFGKGNFSVIVSYWFGSGS